MKTNTLDFDAQALRERILDLAMRGKLVPQDPNDEPASVLLEKIKAEKEELVKEKKIKKTKSLPAITDDEKPFDIPDSWEWVRLGDVTDVVMGQAPKGSNVNDQGEGIEFHQGKTEFTETVIGKSSKYTTDSNKIVDSNFIIMAVRAPVGDVNLLDRKISIGRGLAGIAPYISNKIYIFYYLESIKNYFERRSTGSTFKAINGNTIKNAVVPLPPLSEQSRIAAKIAQLFALLRKVESSTQQYAELQTLLKSKVLDLAMRGKLVKQDPNDEPASVLLEKIKAEKAELVRKKKIKKSKPLPPITDEEKPFDIPDSWEWVRLGNITHFVGTGMVVPASKQYNTPKSNMVPYFKMNNIGNWDGKFNTNNLVYIIEDDKTDKYLLKPGQLLFNTRNSRELVGKTTVVPANLNQKIVSNNNILRIESFHNMKLDYLNYYLISSASRNHFLKLTTATTNVAAIYQKQLINCLVPLPPIAEQRRMVNKILDLYKLI
ncbi:restriction endonuclease subunit S [uncultured Lactobacillus sp.]|jgi:type I restriction enzyme S subunit|uniref:restriction endonuclease subunit S n=1 Tax=uncultured Lactobacillus sp. TaxID=153152 RepID=UPI0025879671|nr:restriction endonuclease subunit S [uncultured Lactobacillus sp.]